MKIKIALYALFCVLLFSWGHSQTRTVGRIEYDDSLTLEGYTLFTPNQSFKSFLIDNCGRLVHEWNSSNQPGMLAYLREDGLLLRAGRDSNNPNFSGFGGNGGNLELIDWNDNIVWEYQVSDAQKQAHHDIEPMPNGNVLVLAWEKFDSARCIQAGREPGQLTDGEIWAEAIYELKPIFPDSAFVVWEWHAWDHLVQESDLTKDNYGNVADHPELLNLNYVGTSGGGKDWLHGNSIAFNPLRNEIILSFRETSEIIILDHSTNTAQAASHQGGNKGHGGDLLYRWGNPAAYMRGTPGDQQLFHQHDARWVEPGLPFEGGITVFNNGDLRPSFPYSSVDFIDPALDSLGNYQLPLIVGYLPFFADSTFSALPNDTIYSAIMSGAHVLSNGSLLITQAVHGRFLEFDQAGTKVWEYISPVLPLSIQLSQGQAVPVLSNGWANAVFRAHKYPLNYPGFGGQVLIPGNYVESNPYPDSCISPVSAQIQVETSFEIGPNPASEALFVHSSKGLQSEWQLIDLQGKICATGNIKGHSAKIALSTYPTGIYCLRIGNSFSKKILIQR